MASCYFTLWSSLIHFACIGVVFPWLFKPQACGSRGSNSNAGKMDQTWSNFTPGSLHIPPVYSQPSATIDLHNRHTAIVFTRNTKHSGLNFATWFFELTCISCFTYVRGTNNNLRRLDNTPTCFSSVVIRVSASSRALLLSVSWVSISDSVLLLAVRISAKSLWFSLSVSARRSVASFNLSLNYQNTTR